MEASQIKRRAEATAAELQSLEALCAKDGEQGTKMLDMLNSDAGFKKSAMQSKKQEAFKQDVKDEELFPSLGAKPVRSSAAGKTVAPVAPVAPEAPAARPLPPSPKPGPVVAENDFPNIADAETSGPLPLKDALLSFLDGKEGNMAHINEVNNDRFLRKVMAAQVPKPVTAVNKAWLAKHEDEFMLYRTDDNELYVAKIRVGPKEVCRADDQPKRPAYRQVIQKTIGGVLGEEEEPVIYHYAKAEKEDKVEGRTSAWQDKFKLELQEAPQETLAAEELLAAVPLFAAAMGLKPKEAQDLLVMFLGTWPDTFEVQKKSVSGSTGKKILIKLKSSAATAAA